MAINPSEKPGDGNQEANALGTVRTKPKGTQVAFLDTGMAASLTAESGAAAPATAGASTAGGAASTAGAALPAVGGPASAPASLAGSSEAPCSSTAGACRRSAVRPSRTR